jgi:hypothetical protein
MAHIIVNPETDVTTGRITGGARFELPADADHSDLPDQLAEVARGNGSVAVGVLVDGGTGLLYLNANSGTVLFVP